MTSHTIDMPELQEAAEKQFIQELLRTGRYNITPITAPQSTETPVNTSEAAPLLTQPLSTGDVTPSLIPSPHMGIAPSSINQPVITSITYPNSTYS